MHGLYVISVWLHIIAAAFWVGGMLFMVFVLIPTLRGLDDQRLAGRLMHWLGVRYRWFGWITLSLLVLTGIVNLFMRGIGWSELIQGDIWRSAFGHMLAVKLWLVALIFITSALHDFVIGPRATRIARAANPKSAEALRVRRQAAWMGRLNLLVGLVVVALGVMLVRGWPW